MEESQYTGARGRQCQVIYEILSRKKQDQRERKEDV